MATRSKDVKKQTYHLKNVIANNTKVLVVYFLILLEILEHIIHSLACERNSISKGTSNIDNLKHAFGFMTEPGLPSQACIGRDRRHATA